MKRVLLICCVILIPFLSHSQDKKGSLALRAAYIGFGGYTFDDSGGVALLGDMTLGIGSNLISISHLYGTEIGVVGNVNYEFHETALLYGREFKATEKLSFEGFAGFGFINQNSDVIDVNDGHGLSVPLRVNSKFYFTKRFGMGINANYSINSINNVLSEI